MEKIFVLKKGSLIRGPFTLSYLQENKLKETDIVWYEGLKDWTKVTEVDALKSCIKKHGTEDGTEPKKSLLNKLLRRK